MKTKAGYLIVYSNNSFEFVTKKYLEKESNLFFYREFFMFETIESPDYKQKYCTIYKKGSKIFENRFYNK